MLSPPNNLRQNARLCGRARFGKSSCTAKHQRRRSSGFTLLELMIVISIIAILLTVAIPTYNQSIQRARERALRADLDFLNQKIEQYTLDKKKPPQSIDDLKRDGYLEQIPVDPMTREPNWEVEQDDMIILSIEQQEPGIIGVHSASSAIGSNGIAYSSW